jgi:hypothetical protein
LEHRLALSSNPFISEFMAANANALADGNGKHPDWIEIHNPNSTSYDISGWYLTDNPAKLTKWQFPTGTILAANEYKVIFCDDGLTTWPAGELHTTFALNKEGEYVALIKPDGATITSEYGPDGTNFPPQYEDISYGIYDPSVKLSNNFDSDLNGFTYQDSVLTNNASEARVDGVWSSTGGNIGTGGLQITGTMSTTGRYVNGGFYKSVSIAAADTYNFAIAYRMVLTDGSNNFHTNEYGEAYLVVKDAGGNILYGSDGTQYLIHLAGKGSDPTGPRDSGWQQSNFNLNLPAGNYTIILALKNSPLTSPISDNNTVVLNFDNLSITASTPSTTSIQYFTSPTPGLANSLGVLGRVENNVEFSQDHGLFISPIDVALACDTIGATIRYTTDGSEPAFNTGTLYTVPIHITGTTVLRATAFKTNYQPSVVETRTYIFLADVLVQSPTGAAPGAGWPAAGTFNGQMIDYGMDPNIVNDPTWGPQMIQALEAIPTMSLVTSPANLFDATTGIYVNALQTGDAWERPASLELIYPDGTTGFQINAGIRIRGSRSAEGDDPKHAFRVIFDQPGAPALNYPLFGDAGPDQFTDIDLQCVQNWSWNLDGTTEASYVRDLFSRLAQRDMGEPYSRGQYYQLYIDGQYWGLYNTDERLNADYAATYFGGNKDDYDVIKIGRTTSYVYYEEASDGNMNAWQDLWNQAKGMWTVNYYKPTFTVSNINDAENVIGNSSLQNDAITAGTSTINYINTGSDGHYTGSVAFPGTTLTTNSDNFVIEAMGTIKLTVGGNWTFGLSTSESFSFELSNGANTYSFTYTGTGTVADVLRTFNVAAGDYNLRIVYFESTGGANLELYAASGSYTTFNASVFHLIGDTASGGIGFSGMASNVAYQRIQGLNPDGTKNPHFDKLLDPVNLADYLLMIYYTGNYDAPVSSWVNFPNNFYAIYDRANPDGFKFIAHDSEHTLNSPVSYNANRLGPFSNGNTFDQNNPQWIHQQLINNAEYRLLFADRANKFLTGNGALTLAANQARYDAITAQINMAIIAESARWGDAKTEPALTKTTWLDCIARERAWLNTRTDIVLNQLRSFSPSLYPDATYPIPTANLSNGVVPYGSILTLATGSGTIYYTLDGSDPRLFGGGISPAALLYSGTPITLHHSTMLKARTFYGGGNWSPLKEGDYYIGTTAASTNLAITEINYHPYAPTAAEIAAGYSDAEMFEFVEIKNIGSTNVDISQISFTFGVTWNAGYASDQSYSLAPGDIVVIVSNPAAFAYRYGGGIPIVGVYSGHLDNAGEKITLVNRLGQVISNIHYSDSGAWPGRADGNGSTLQIIDPAGDENDPNNWRSSVEYGGTPGDDGLLSYDAVIINEVLTHSDTSSGDELELYNTTGYAINIGGWYLSDSSSDYEKYRIPNGTIIAAHGYLVFTEEDDFGAYFAFDAHNGDDAWLLTADSSGNLQYFADHVDFGAALNGVSFGRWPNGENDSVLYPMASQTFGSANSGPATSAVVISEVYYSPGNNNYEFVEIYNTTSSAVDLSHWKLGDAVDFDFSTGSVTTLGAHQTLVVVENITSFHSLFGTSITIAGQYTGNLDDGGETLTLYSYDTPPADDPTFYPAIVEDQVKYDNASPWPVISDGESLSLQRVAVDTWGNDATNWTAGTPTPGSYTATSKALIVDAADWAAAGSSGLTLTIGADAKVHVYITGTTTDVVTPHLPAYITNVSVTGRDNVADVLTVNFSSGDPISSGGVTFDGGSGGGNALLIIGVSGNDEVTLTDDQIAVNGSEPIGYANTTLFGFDLGTGTNTLTVDDATLTIHQANAISANTDVIVDGGVLDLNGLSDTIGELTLLSGSIVNGTLTADSYTIESGNVTAALAGPGAIHKTTSGQADIAAINNTNTTVEEGKLTANSITTGTLTIGAGTVVTINAISGGPTSASAAVTLSNTATLTSSSIIAETELNADASTSSDTSAATSSNTAAVEVMEPIAIVTAAAEEIVVVVTQSESTTAAATVQEQSATAGSETAPALVESDYLAPISLQEPLTESIAAVISNVGISTADSAPVSSLFNSSTIRPSETVTARSLPQSPVYWWFNAEASRLQAIENNLSDLILETRLNAGKDRIFSSTQDELSYRKTNVKKQSGVMMQGGQTTRNIALLSIIQDSQGKNLDEQLDLELHYYRHFQKQDKLLEKAVDAVLAWD